MIIILILLTITICGNMKFLSFFSFLLFSNALLAKGQPTEWQLSFQEAGSPLMQKLIDFHDFVFGL